jgi:hypothetical protein
MIKVGARQNYRASSLLRRLSTGNDQTRPLAPPAMVVVSLDLALATPILPIATG